MEKKEACIENWEKEEGVISPTPFVPTTLLMCPLISV
jgi:hypothetical protein